MDVFTPLNEERTERLRFDAKDVAVLAGDLDTRGIGKHAVVEIHGKRYEVYGIDCSLENCCCDAYLKAVA